MLKLERWRMMKYFEMKEKFINDETGATNVIEIALVLIVIVAVASLFSGGMKEIANSLIARIKDIIGNFG